MTDVERVDDRDIVEIIRPHRLTPDHATVAITAKHLRNAADTIETQRAEIADLKHDLERLKANNTDLVNEVERLRVENSKLWGRYVAIAQGRGKPGDVRRAALSREGTK